jgi:hypothetical protein
MRRGERGDPRLPGALAEHPAADLRAEAVRLDAARPMPREGPENVAYWASGLAPT